MRGDTDSGVEPMTMDQFGESVDAFLGRSSGFAEAVRTLARAKAVQTAASDFRGRCREAVRDSVERSPAAVVASGHRAVWVPPKTTLRSKLDTTALKRHRPDAYAAARRLRPYVTVSAPRPMDVDLGLHLDDFHGTPAERAVAAWAAVADVPAVAKAAADKEQALTVLHTIAEDTGWDGSLRRFTDAWKVGLTALRFSADDLPEDVRDAFTDEVETTRSGYVLVGAAGLETVDEVCA